VAYEVCGSAYTVDVIYENSSGGTWRVFGVGMPWSYTFYADPGGYVYIGSEHGNLLLGHSGDLGGRGELRG